MTSLVTTSKKTYTTLFGRKTQKPSYAESCTSPTQHKHIREDFKPGLETPLQNYLDSGYLVLDPKL